MINERYINFNAVNRAHVEYEAKFNIVFQDYEIKVSAFMPKPNILSKQHWFVIWTRTEDAGLQHKLQKYDDKRQLNKPYSN